MTMQEQLRLWLQGKPTHRKTNRSGIQVCCPDFSCCRAELLWPEDKRAKYVNGTPDDKLAMAQEARESYYKLEPMVMNVP